jgi:HAD superfamily hydrolase (TIGR01458 family)
MSDILNGIKTIVFDLDGTVFFKDKLIDGVGDTLKRLREKGYNLRFVTNTDSIDRKTISDKVKSYGLELPVEEIYNCSIAAVKFMESRKDKTCFVLASDKILPEFDHLPFDDENPDYVVIGDFRDKVSYPIINKAFRCIHNGADIVAMQDGGYMFTGEGINLDTGAFVKMFEYASGKNAILVGKPSAEFFNIALAGTDSRPEETLVVGDDLSSDIKGAKNIGGKGVLVRTGKFSEEWLASSDIKPDYVIDSASYLI